MSRKLAHSIRAIIVSFGVLVAVVATSLPGGVASPAPSAATGIAIAGDATQTAPTVETAAVPKPIKHRSRRRDAREEMTLPFFSFAHGLRRGNGS